MEKTDKILWLTLIPAFLIILGFWLHLKKPAWLKFSAPEPKYVNFETLSQGIQSCVVKINLQGINSAGVIIHPRGYVLTLLPKQKISSTLSTMQTANKDLYLTSYSNESFSGEIVKIDKKTGFCVLKITVDKEFMPVQIVSSKTNKQGDLLFSTIEGKTTISRVIKSENKFIEADVPAENVINGLPVFNQDSQMVGLYIKETNQVRIISISRAKPLLTEISGFVPEIIYTSAGTSKVKWLGAVMVPETGFAGASLVVENTGVQTDSRHELKLKPGDRITKINNKRINGLPDLERTIPALAQYKKIHFTVIREGKEKKISFRPQKTSIPGSFYFSYQILVLLIFAFVYYLAYIDLLERTMLFVLGAVLMVICGSYLDFYTSHDAFRAWSSKIDVIFFIIGMGILTIVLSEGGLFKYIGNKILLWTKGDKWKIMFGLCTLTYFFSLFVNNLTAIMGLLPMFLYLTKQNPSLKPKPYVIGMIVASNLGGASTLIGDFPNMLIAVETGIGFTQFIRYMMPICAIELVLFLIYMRYSMRALFYAPDRLTVNISEELPQLAYSSSVSSKLKDSAGKTKIKNPKMLKTGLMILGILFISFIAAEFLHINPALMALFGGMAAWFLTGIRPGVISLYYKDILFFSGLFILVGAAEASGLLKWLSKIILHFSFGNPVIQCLLLMWVAGAATAFLNAGPATALFLPLTLNIMHQNSADIHNVFFWALSLGILAGSSATLAGATAGSVSASMLDKFFSANKSGNYSPLTFREYAKTGIPVAMLFLIASSVYIILII